MILCVHVHVHVLHHELQYSGHAVKCSVVTYVLSVPRPSSIHVIIVRVLIVRGRKTFEIGNLHFYFVCNGEGLGTEAMM